MHIYLISPYSYLIYRSLVRWFVRVLIPSIAFFLSFFLFFPGVFSLLKRYIYYVCVCPTRVELRCITYDLVWSSLMIESAYIPDLHIYKQLASSFKYYYYYYFKKRGGGRKWFDFLLFVYVARLHHGGDLENEAYRFWEVREGGGRWKEGKVHVWDVVEGCDG